MTFVAQPTSIGLAGKVTGFTVREMGLASRSDREI